MHIRMFTSVFSHQNPHSLNGQVEIHEFIQIPRNIHSQTHDVRTGSRMLSRLILGNALRVQTSLNTGSFRIFLRIKGIVTTRTRPASSTKYYY